MSDTPSSPSPAPEKIPYGVPDSGLVADLKEHFASPAAAEPGTTKPAPTEYLKYCCDCGALVWDSHFAEPVFDPFVTFEGNVIRCLPCEILR